ncbi:hypothetical protein GCM10023086_16140 [Streptomyces venetus]|uniref:Uncharacterized protein n=1 Tax=Streptomyces venetus TaxID=1701086 RepID=A0ABP8FCR4_9ACTN
MIGDPVLWAPPSKDTVPDPGPRGPARIPTCRLPGQWVASWKGARPWGVTASPPAGTAFGFGRLTTGCGW